MSFSIATYEEQDHKLAVDAQQRSGLTLASLQLTDNRPEATIQRKQLAYMGNHDGGISPITGGHQVVQLTRWQWDALHNKWINLDDPLSLEEQPEFDGGWDGEIYDDDPKGKRKKDEGDEAFHGKRTIGDSYKLAQNRYNRVKKTRDFKSWKKGRHAQHLVPASSAKKPKSLHGIIDDEDNGMMLPDVYSVKNRKVTHLKPKHRDHPKYTQQVNRLIGDVLKNTSLKDNQTTMKMVMDAVRPVNKLWATYHYLDDIPYFEFKKSWNLLNPMYPI